MLDRFGDRALLCDFTAERTGVEPAVADAEHREALHSASEERSALAAHQTALLVEMVGQNTQLTQTVKALAERVETLTLEVHKAVCNARTT